MTHLALKIWIFSKKVGALVKLAFGPQGSAL
jgi:hypothetical protein